MSDSGLFGVELAIVQKLRVDGPQGLIDLVVELAQPPSLVLGALEHLQADGTIEVVEVDGEVMIKTPMGASSRAVAI